MPKDVEEVKEEIDEEEEEVKKPKEKWGVGEIATQTAPVTLERKTGKGYTQQEVNAIILNKLEKLEKGMLG